jgi:hypothetical protein
MKKLLLVITLVSTFAFAQVKENIQVPYIPYEVKMGVNFVEVQSNCLSCHSFGYIINQGPQSRKFWKGKVVKMITHFKASMDDKTVELITDYLEQNYGNGK